MSASSPRTGSISPKVKAELRQRILEIVNRKSGLTDGGIWQESAPKYFPWRAMIEEIKALDKEKKLRLEIVGPGHWIIHSLESHTGQAKAGKSRPGKGTKRRART